MSSEITVNTAILNTDVETLQKELNLIQDELGKMYDAVNVLDSMWEGPANIAFVNQFSKDKGDMEALCKTIQKLIDCMSNARKEYDACEYEISQIVASIPI